MQHLGEEIPVHLPDVIRRRSGAIAQVSHAKSIKLSRVARRSGTLFSPGPSIRFVLHPTFELSWLRSSSSGPSLMCTSHLPDHGPPGRQAGQAIRSPAGHRAAPIQQPPSSGLGNAEGCERPHPVPAIPSEQGAEQCRWVRSRKSSALGARFPVNSAGRGLSLDHRKRSP